MSKERELLERWVSQFGNLRHDFNLLTETKELLAQPEQTEQEPKGYVIYKPKGSKEEEIIPLYTSPPKREPLTSKLISLGNNCHESFIKGIRFAEKMHGIGGGEE
jgi:hypothetical protein